MAHTAYTFLVVAEDGTSHEHHTRQRTGRVDTWLRRAVGATPTPILLAAAHLVAWRDAQGPSLGRRPNPVAGLLIAHLGGPRVPLHGPIAVTGYRDGTARSLTTAQVDAVLAVLTHCR
ncbi:hypothetical protein DDE19_14100 [Micromonospora ureilytica]|uniref:Uncharacterized protein n=1 Tax=Micromonospora ureilytica TaxID=709868 RepID=A0A3N9XUB3_9ACTN|nr:hypothetical protein [Micromonospora ureilytica]RQX16705.1 hypothetical protein DDE19_14100 [Micromonospora ureilytica]